MLQQFFEESDQIMIPAGEIIQQQGARCENYFLLDSGIIKVFSRSAAGRELVLYRITEGNICVLTTSCLLSHKQFPAEAFSETDLVLKIMPVKQFNLLLQDSIEFRDAVFSSFGHRIGDLIQTIEQLTLLPVEVRLARYFLRNPAVIENMTHQSIADEIGSVREVVSRQLKRFENNGWLRLQRKCIEVIDRQAIEKVAQE